MERNSERSFCCGAGGARMWMEENIGERINVNRTVEAVGTGADQIAVGCPYCRVMLSDGLTAQQAKGEAREEVEVLDVAQMLLASVKGERATRLVPGAGGAPAARSAGTTVETKAEPEAGDETQTADTVTETADVGPAAKASGGSSLFDTPADSETATEDKSVAEEAKAAKPASSGGSLFDLGGDTDATAEAKPTAETQTEVTQVASDTASVGSLFDIAGDTPESERSTVGSLFDIATDEPAAQEAKAEPAPKAAPKKAEPTAAAPATAEIAEGGSLFDIAVPEPAPAPEAEATKAEEPQAEQEPEPEPEPEPESKEKPKPPASGEAQQPKTGVDINESGSLFDL
jgi:hypothetical protein